MKILHKMLSIYLFIIIAGILIIFIFLSESDKLLSKSISKSLLASTVNSMEAIDKSVYHNIEYLQAIASADHIKKTLQESNGKFLKIKNLQSFIENRDNEWTASSNNTTHPFISEILNNESSQQLINDLKLFNAVENHLQFNEVFFTNKYGAIAGMSNKTTDYRQDDEEWWIMTKNDGIFFNDVVFDQSVNALSISIGIKIEDDKGNFIGVLKGVLAIEGIFDLINKEEKTLQDALGYKSIHLKLLDEHKHIIYDSLAYLPKDKNIHSGEVFKFADRLSEKDGFFIEKGDEGLDSEIFVYASSRDFNRDKVRDWTLLTEYSTDEIFIPLNDLRNQFIIGVFAFICVIAIIAFYITFKITAPIIRLKKTAEKIGEGDFAARTTANTNDEMGELANAINAMSENLQKITVSKKELKKEIEDRKKIEMSLFEQKNMLSSITEAAQEAIFLIDENSLTIYTNNSACKMFGYSKEAFLGKNLHDLIVPKKYYAKYETAFKKFAKTGEGNLIGKVVEVTALKKDNTEFPVSISISSVKLDEKWHAVGVIYDITERKKAEAEIKQKTKMMLAQSRQAAMGEMLSMIAHQWRQPLSIISTIVANIQVEKYLGTLNIDNIEESLIKINEEAQFLSNTINDFRNFFKQDKALESITPGDILNKVVSMMEYSLKLNGITLAKECSFSKPFFTYPRELLQVFLNIVNNAKDALLEKSIAEPKIEIKIYEKDTTLIFEISDNAGGIPEEIKDKIFDPYFTTKDEENGTGLGLFMSKSIIEKHLHGIISCSNKNNGACFSIMLPIAEQTEEHIGGLGI